MGNALDDVEHPLVYPLMLMCFKDVLCGYLRMRTLNVFLSCKAVSAQLATPYVQDETR